MTLLHMPPSAGPNRCDGPDWRYVYFPEQARVVFRLRVPDSNLAARTAELRRLRGARDARSGPDDPFGRFQDSYDDINFTPPLLGSIKARRSSCTAIETGFSPSTSGRDVPRDSREPRSGLAECGLSPSLTGYGRHGDTCASFRTSPWRFYGVHRTRDDVHGRSTQGLTIVALDERPKDCSFRSLLFDSLASELGRYTATT